METPRNLQQRKQDTLGRLESDVDAWIASADAEGNAYLLPLSFLWDGSAERTPLPSTDRMPGSVGRLGFRDTGITVVRVCAP